MKSKQFQAIFALNLTIIFSGCFGYNQPQIPKELQNCNNDVTPICVYEFDYTKADLTHETAIKIDRFCQNLPREKLLATNLDMKFGLIKFPICKIILDSIKLKWILPYQFE